ncbi:MAG: tetratricopeptide repeat protein [Planctomycetaceae bacterium]|nr:tetratricopeptide repeat protein [Planctomycetaceae bacterium]
MSFKIKQQEYSSKKTAVIISVCLAAAVIAVYAPVYKYDFTSFDDNTYVVQNVHIRAGLIQTARWAFTATTAANWHPLTWLSLATDYQLFKIHAGGFHVVNVLYHIINTLLLFYLFKYLTNTIWPSAFIAAAFALHPLHVESVAWVAERKDVLSTMFWFLTTLAYVSYTKQCRGEPMYSPNSGQTHRSAPTKWYLAAITLFILGLMSKPMLVTLPVVLLLMDYWPLERKVSFRLFIEKIPFFLLSLASCGVTFIVQRDFGSMSFGETVGLKTRICNAIVSYSVYLWKTIWPAELAMLYPHPGDELSKYQIAFSVLLLVVIFVCIIFLRKYKFFTVGWLWYFVTLLPVIGLVQVGAQAYADRYTYIPLIGVFMIMTFSSVQYLSKRNCVFLSMLLLACWAVVSGRQVRYWQNDETLFTNTLRNTKNNDVILGNYINYLISKNRIDEAVAKTDELLKFKPDSYQAHCNLGVILIQKNKFDEAEKHFALAVKYNPGLAQGYLNLGLVASYKKNTDAAIKYFRQAIETKPDYMDAYICLAITLNNLNRADEAAEICRVGLRIEPNNEVLQRQLKLALEKNGTK